VNEDYAPETHFRATLTGRTDKALFLRFENESRDRSVPRSVITDITEMDCEKDAMGEVLDVFIQTWWAERNGLL
jgi:hypothetical protein